jgi:hypothetical protein
VKFADKLAVTKELVSILAAICVAIWAVYSTWIKKEEHIAELQVLELQQKTSLQSHVIPEMSVEQLQKGGDGTILSVLVKLENTGNEMVRISLDDRSVLIVKVEFQDNQSVYGDPVYIGRSRYKGLRKVVGPFIDIGPSEKYQISYVSRIEEPGVYLVRFLSKMDGDSVQGDKKRNLGRDSMTEYHAGIDKIIYID